MNDVVWRYVIWFSGMPITIAILGALPGDEPLWFTLLFAVMSSVLFERLAERIVR